RWANNYRVKSETGMISRKVHALNYVTNNSHCAARLSRYLVLFENFTVRLNLKSPISLNPTPREAPQSTFSCSLVKRLVKRSTSLSDSPYTSLTRTARLHIHSAPLPQRILRPEPSSLPYRQQRCRRQKRPWPSRPRRRSSSECARTV